MKKTLFITVLTALICTTQSMAQTVTLDPAFGTGGIVDVPVDQANSSEAAYAMVLQNDGKIILGGSKGQYACLKRYNTDGSVDTAFGNQGLVNGAVTGLATPIIYDVALTPDNKIIAAMTVDSKSMALVKFNTNGTIDTAFGINGVVAVDVYPNNSTLEVVTKVVVDANGKIVLFARLMQESNYTAFVGRFEPNGIVDASFGSGYGIITQPMSWVHTGAVQADGKVLVLGTTYITSSIAATTVSRYLTDGTPDVEFGNMGTQTLQGGLDDFYCRDMLLQPDGKIVVGGQGEPVTGIAGFCFGRLNTDGSLDTQFGTNGTSVFTTGNMGVGHKLALQPDGKIVASGFAGINIYGFTRITTNGTLDTTFGNNGLVTHYMDDNQPNPSTGLVIQPDGKILVGGSFFHQNTVNFMLMRYLNNITTGVKESNLPGLTVYPNPAQNILYLKNAEDIEISNLMVADSSGKIILQQAGSASAINISMLPQGLYFLKIVTPQGNHMQKFIKQ